MAAKLSIGFLGAGKMATALAKGVIASGLAKPAQMRASDPAPAARSVFSEQTGVTSTASNSDVVNFARLLILAVKPGNVNDLLAEIRGAFTPGHLLISIAAGVPIARLESALGQNARVIRAMPNTPAFVNASATAFACGTAATDADAALARKFLSAVGMVIEVKEQLLDAVTGLSGSGPAYIYIIIEALSDGGVASGLPRDVATRLAAQTVFGSAKMVLDTGQHPGALKDMVTSPGGTTVEGLHELEKGGLRGIIISAVRAATEKSKKLGG